MIKRLLVPDAFADNFLQITSDDSPCCGDGLDICQYDVTYTQANTVSLLNITEGGVARALPAVPATTSAADVKAAIDAALIAAGYIDEGAPTGVTVVDNGTTLTVTITGDVVAVSLTTSGGAAVFNQDCTSTSLCTYTLVGSAGGATNNLNINGIDNALGAIVPGTTLAAAVKTAVETAMTASGVTGTVAVTTTGSGGATLYTIAISGSAQENGYVLNGTSFVRSACSQSYI